MDKENNQDLKINTLETNYLVMSEQIKDLKKTVEKGFEELKDEFKCIRKEADKKYASKLTEKIVYGLVGIVLTTFIVSLNYLIFK